MAYFASYSLFRPVYTYSVVYRCTSGIQPIKTWTASSRGCLKLIYPRLNINWRDISFLTWTGDNQERYNKYALCLKTSVLAFVTTLLREAYSLESCFLWTWTILICYHQVLTLSTQLQKKLFHVIREHFLGCLSSLFGSDENGCQMYKV